MHLYEFEGNADVFSKKVFAEYIKQKWQNCCSHGREILTTRWVHG
jgi:hypothetical protein